MAIPVPTGRRRPRSDVDHALDVGALAREHAFDLTLRRGSRADGAWMTGWRRTGRHLRLRDRERNAEARALLGKASLLGPDDGLARDSDRRQAWR